MPDIYGIDENVIASLPEAARTKIYDALRVQHTVERLGQKPEARDEIQRIVATHAPELAGPEARARQLVSDELGKLREELKADRDARAKADEDEKADRARRDLERRWLEGREYARSQGYTDEGIESLQAWMEKNGVAEHKIAIPAFERENPPPEPVMTGSQRWNFFEPQQNGEIDIKPLLDGNEEGFLGSAIQQALKDVRSGR